MFYQTGGNDDVALTHSGVKATLFPAMAPAKKAMEGKDGAVMIAMTQAVCGTAKKCYVVWLGGLLAFQEWRVTEKTRMVQEYNSMHEVLAEGAPVKLFADVDMNLTTPETIAHAEQAKTQLLKDAVSFFKGMRKSFLETRTGPLQIYSCHRMKTDRDGNDYYHLSYHIICDDLVFDDILTQKRAWECYRTRIGETPKFFDKNVYRRNGLVRLPGAWKMFETDMHTLTGLPKNDILNPTKDYVLSCGHGSAIINEERLHAKFSDVLKVVDAKSGRSRASPKAAQGYLNDVACRMLAESMEFPVNVKYQIRVDTDKHAAIVTAAGTPRCVVTGNIHKFTKSALMVNLLNLDITRTCRSDRCISPQPYYVKDPENLFLAVIQACHVNAGWKIEDDRPLLNSISTLTSEKQDWRRIDVGAILSNGGDKVSRGDVTFVFNDTVILMSAQGQLLVFDLPTLEVINDDDEDVDEEEEVGEKRKRRDGLDTTLVLALMHRRELVSGLALKNSAIAVPLKANVQTLNTFFRRHLDYLMSTQGLCIDSQNRLYALDGYIYREIVGAMTAECKQPLARYLRHQAILHGGPDLNAFAHEWTPSIQAQFEANIHDLSGTMSIIERTHCHAFRNGVLFLPSSITEENEDVASWFQTWEELRVRGVHGVFPMTTHECNFDPAWKNSTESFPDLMGIFRFQGFTDDYTGKSLGMVIGKSVMSKPLATEFNRDKTDMVPTLCGASQSGKTRILNLVKSYFPVDRVKETGNGRGSTLGALAEFVDRLCDLIVFGDMDSSSLKFFKEEFNLQVLRAIVDGTSVPVSILNSRTEHHFINSALLMAANPGMLGHENIAVGQSLQALISIIRRKLYILFSVSAGANRDDMLEQKMMQPVARAAALVYSLQQYVNIYLNKDGYVLYQQPEVQAGWKSILCEYSHIYAYLNASAHIGVKAPENWHPIRPCNGKSVSIRELRQAAGQYAASNGRRVKVETCNANDVVAAFEATLAPTPEFKYSFVANGSTGNRYYYCQSCMNIAHRFVKGIEPHCVCHTINSGPYVANGSILNAVIEGLEDGGSDCGDDDGYAPGFRP